jgi:hypothetical protein
MKDNFISPKFARLVSDTARWGMEAEVMMSALTIMQQHPHATPELCLELACREWDVI